MSALASIIDQLPIPNYRPKDDVRRAINQSPGEAARRPITA